MNFKRKYHSSYAKSAQYVARELEAEAKLQRNLGRWFMVVRNGVGVGTAGLVSGYSSGVERFDFAIASMADPRKVYVLVEVTGDLIDDVYAYILSDKLEKAFKSPIPVFFMYEKRRKHMWRVFSREYVKRYGELIKWLEGEKPYYRVILSKGWYFREWLVWLRKHYIPYAERNRKYIIIA